MLEPELSHTNSDLLKKIKFSLLLDGTSAPPACRRAGLLPTEKFLKFPE